MTKLFTKLLAKQKLSEMLSEMFSRFARALGDVERCREHLARPSKFCSTFANEPMRNMQHTLSLPAEVVFVL